VTCGLINRKWFYTTYISDKDDASESSSGSEADHSKKDIELARKVKKAEEDKENEPKLPEGTYEDIDQNEYIPIVDESYFIDLDKIEGPVIVTEHVKKLRTKQKLQINKILTQIRKLNKLNDLL